VHLLSGEFCHFHFGEKNGLQNLFFCPLLEKSELRNQLLFNSL